MERDIGRGEGREERAGNGRLGPGGPSMRSDMERAKADLIKEMDSPTTTEPKTPFIALRRRQPTVGAPLCTRIAECGAVVGGSIRRSPQTTAQEGLIGQRQRGKPRYPEARDGGSRACWPSCGVCASSPLQVLKQSHVRARPPIRRPPRPSVQRRSAPEREETVRGELRAIRQGTFLSTPLQLMV